MPEVLAANQIDKSNVKYNAEMRTYDFSDEAALALILKDASTIDAWMNTQQWASNWLQSDMLRQSPSSSFDSIAGMSVPKFTLSNTISAIVPKIMSGLFYDDPPILLRPRPKVKPEIVRGKTALFSYQFDEMKFKEEVEVGVDQMADRGTGIWKWGWLKKKKKIKKYVNKEKPISIDTPYLTASVHTPLQDEYEVEVDEKEDERPWIKSCLLGTVLVDIGCRRGDITKAKEVIHREYPTWEEVEDLRDVEDYDIPSREDLEEFFLNNKSSVRGDNLVVTLPENMRGYLQHAAPRNYNTTADPFQQPICLLERTDKDKVIAVLQMGAHNFLIRNGPNPYGKINYYSCNWRNLPDSFYGQGLGQLIGSEQMVDQGTTALALGMLAYGLQPTAVRKEGFNAISQPTRWELGGIIRVEDDVDKAFKFLEFPRIPPEAFQMIMHSQATAAETSGANQQTTMGAGAAGIKTTGMRSGTGAALVGQAAAERLDGPLERFIEQVFIPWIYQIDELNNDRLPTSILNEILTQEIAEDFKVDHIEFRNAKIEYEVLAGRILGAKKQMEQFMPFVMQLVNNPTLMELAAEQGLYFNFKAWFDQFSDLAGIKFNQDLFAPMTPQQQKIRAANSPAGIAATKGQAAQQTQLQKFQQEQQLLDQEQLGKGANEVLRLTTEHALQSEELGGSDPGAGLGDTEIG